MCSITMDYFKNHHQIEKPIVVVHTEMKNAVAINLAHSQYDIIPVPVGPCRTTSSVR